MDATDNETARKILWEVCRYLQEGLQGEIEGWNPRPDASEVIMYLRGYSYYRECVALKPKKNIGVLESCKFRVLGYSFQAGVHANCLLSHESRLTYVNRASPLDADGEGVVY